MSTQERTMATADEAKHELSNLHAYLAEEFVQYSVEHCEPEGRYGYYRQTTFTITSWLDTGRIKNILDRTIHSHDDWRIGFAPSPGFTATFQWDPNQDAA